MANSDGDRNVFAGLAAPAAVPALAAGGGAELPPHCAVKAVAAPSAINSRRLIATVPAQRSGSTDCSGPEIAWLSRHQRFPFFSSSARYSHERQASAMIVHVGFWHEALTWLLPSTTNRFLTSCDCWN